MVRNTKITLVKCDFNLIIRWCCPREKKSSTSPSDVDRIAVERAKKGNVRFLTLKIVSREAIFSRSHPLTYVTQM